MCWKVNLARAIRLNVGLDELLPQAADVIAIVEEVVLRLRIGEPVAVGLHGELESLETVVLGEVGHKGTQGVGLGGRVCEDLLQVGQAKTERGGQADGS